MSPSQDSEFPEPDSMTVDPANLGSVDPCSVEGIFLVALGKSGSERDAFLSGQCVDASQRQRVEALLFAYEQAGNFLQTPAVGSEPAPIRQYLDQCALPGTLGKLGPYEILEEIGRGGMGVVFRAHDPKLQRIVAVKALAPELARLPTARQRFLREARAAAAVSHPHVVTIFAVEGTEEASLGTERTTLPFLVMECIVGQTLHDKIKRVGALKVEEIVRISRQIAEGLTAAHKRGLIHRDIKPANILLENGVERVKITDFGLARTTSDGGITHTGEILGTPQCMSPEQARGEIVDQRSDLFSLGCVMYTMCTGVSPFRADNMLAVMKKVCESEPRPIAQINPNLPEWLCELVHRLLEKEPERRVQTAEEVVQVLESRVVAAGPPPAQTISYQQTLQSSRPHPDEGVPKWLLTPIIPGLKRLLFSDGLLSVTLIAMLIGFLLGEDRESLILMLPVAGAIGIGLLALVKVCLEAHWRWVNWKAMISVPLGMFLGGMSRAWLIHKSRSGVGPLEELARNHAGWLIFPLAITIFWLLNRWFPQLFIQNPGANRRQIATPISQVPQPAIASPASVGAERREPRPPLSFWSVLGWMLVGLFGIGFIAGIPLAIAVIVRDFRAQSAGTPTAAYVIRIPAAENLKYVTIDGIRPFLQLGGPNEWRISTTPGKHNIYISYDSDSVLNQERFYTTTAHVDPGGTSVISAEPVMVRSLTRTALKQPISPTAEMPIDLLSSLSNRSNTESTPEIPLADSIEVLTDLTAMPVPAMATMSGELGAGTREMVQAVWIDEPGLLVRMKRLGFEGSKDGETEYYSKVPWGTGPFMKVTESGEVPCDLAAGRYHVLVQDLDYGWPMDRRGVITIGNVPLYVHVKRSFQAHHLLSSGNDQFPLTFRWAGKTYEITTPDEVQMVNGLLRATAEKSAFFVDSSFRSHPVFTEAVQVDPQGGGHSLKHERTTAQIEIQSPDMRAGFISPLGRIEWKGPYKPLGGLFVPRQELRMFVKDELIGWDTLAWYDNQPIAIDDPLATPLVVRRDRALIKKFAETEPPQSQVINLWFQWFGINPDLPRRSATAIRRLISAWADGQPDVPEAELLQLGGARTLAELFIRPASLNAAPAVTVETVEPKTEESNAEFVPPAFLVPGSTPGKWRMKEPPDGAVAPN